MSYIYTRTANGFCVTTLWKTENFDTQTLGLIYFYLNFALKKSVSDEF